MLPFSKRPPPPEEYFLRSGEFEAVLPQELPSQSPRTSTRMPVAVMSAPPPSVFARHAAPTPCGFTHNQSSSYGYRDLSAPPPPHSLEPMAMISERTGPSPASTARRASRLNLGEKPSLKWGVMIALTGALLGGVLGLGMDANRARVGASAALPAAATPALATPALATPALATPALATPAAATAGAAQPPVSVLAVNGAIVVPVAARSPVVLASPAPVIVTLAKADPLARPEKRTKAPASAKSPSFVAAKVSAPKPQAAEKADRSEPAPKREPVAKPEKAPRSEKEPAKTGSSDARKVLEDAIKDTANTL